MQREHICVRARVVRLGVQGWVGFTQRVGKLLLFLLLLLTRNLLLLPALLLLLLHTD